MLNKDRLITGVIIGVALPAAFFTMFYIIMENAAPGSMHSGMIEKVILLFIGLNALIMHHFMVRRNQDEIGKGILLSTFVGALFYVTYYYTDFI